MNRMMTVKDIKLFLFLHLAIFKYQAHISLVLHLCFNTVPFGEVILSWVLYNCCCSAVNTTIVLFAFVLLLLEKSKENIFSFFRKRKNIMNKSFKYLYVII